MAYTCLWLAFNGWCAVVSTPPVLCNVCNVGLHLNGFQPYKGILMYQASKKTDFTVDPIWVGLAVQVASGCLHAFIILVLTSLFV